MPDNLTQGLIVASGIYALGFAGFHVFFWRLLDWPETLRGGGAMNNGVIQTLNVMLIYVFGVYGVALLVLPSNGTASGWLLLVGFGFWLLRLALQWTLFDVRHPVVRLLTVIFTIGALLHAAAAATIILE